MRHMWTRSVTGGQYLADGVEVELGELHWPTSRLEETTLLPPEICFEHNLGALIIRIGFWGLLIIIMGQYSPKPYSNS